MHGTISFSLLLLANAVPHVRSTGNLSSLYIKLEGRMIDFNVVC